MVVVAVVVVVVVVMVVTGGDGGGGCSTVVAQLSVSDGVSGVVVMVVGVVVSGGGWFNHAFACQCRHWCRHLVVVMVGANDVGMLVTDDVNDVGIQW